MSITRVIREWSCYQKAIFNEIAFIRNDRKYFFFY